MKTLRFAAALSALCLTFSGISANAVVTMSEYLRGDVNCDGAVNQKDYDMLIEQMEKWLCGFDMDLTMQASQNADVNKDDHIDLNDCNDLKNYLNNGKWPDEEETLPPPSGICGENLTWTLSDDGTLTITGTGELSGFLAQALPWADHVEKITKIVLPETLRIIPNNIFSGCTNLTEVTLPDSVLLIGHSAFENCASLQTITIPENVDFIGINAFAGTGLKALTILNKSCYMEHDEEGGIITALPDNGECVIRGYDSSSASRYADETGFKFESLGEAPELKKAPKGVCGSSMVWELADDGTLTISGEGAMENYILYPGEALKAAEENPAPWSDYSSEIKTVKLNDGVTTVGSFAFYGCGFLENVSIPDGLTEIGDQAFSNTGEFSAELPDSIKRIGEGAFSYSGIAIDRLPKSLDKIEGGILFWNIHVKDITVHAGIQEIGESAFEKCAGLETVTIENPECIIADSANTFCNGSGYGASAEDGYIVDNEGYGVRFTGTIRGYTGSTAEAYAKKYNYKFESLGAAPAEQPVSGECGENLTWEFDAATGTLTVSGNGTMTNWSASSEAPWRRCLIKKVVIEEGVTNIGDYAFCNNGGMIESIGLPESITSIGEAAFIGCSRVQSVVLPKAVASIGARAFFDCAELEKITILNPECEIDVEGMPFNTQVAAHPEYQVGCTICGYDGSTAEAYAKPYGKFESLGAKPITPPALEPTLRGDLDLSKVVDVADAVILARYLVGDDSFAVPDQGLANADADSSGKIENTDVNYIIRMIVGLV